MQPGSVRWQYIGCFRKGAASISIHLKSITTKTV
jgi:hypothetical protein